MALGFKSVRAMLDSMTALDLRKWEIYELIEPFGERAAYWRAGLIAATIANVNRSKNARTFTVEDFMPPIFSQKKPASMKHRAAQITERFKLMADREKLKKS